MTGGLVPNRDLRMSDADREAVVARLNAAVSEGRLTLQEFEERVDGVLHSRTYGEIEPYLADLPVGAAPASVPAGRETAELRNHASSLKRTGRWSVPRRLRLVNKAGSVKLDFVEASIHYPVVEIDLDVMAGSVELVLPHGATADLDGVDQIASSLKSRVPASYDQPGTGPRFVISGKQRASSLKVRYQHRFWWWRW